MLTAREVEDCLRAGREALALLAELVVAGKRTRGEAYLRAQAEHDALVSLLDAAPQAMHDDINALIDRFDKLMSALVN